jgi:hypothetical protein
MIIMEFAAAVEQGNDSEEMEAFISSHSSIIGSVLKSGIAVFYKTLDHGHDNKEEPLLDYTIPLLLSDNPIEITIMPGTVSKEKTIMGGSCPINVTDAVGGLYSIESEVGPVGKEGVEEVICLFSVILYLPFSIVILPLALLAVYVLCADPDPKVCFEPVQDGLSNFIQFLLNPQCWFEALCPYKYDGDGDVY